MQTKTPNFDAPIPGMGLTHELKARPWQNPPQYTTVDEVVEHYTSKMMSDDFSERLIDIMDMGIPLTTIANTIQISGVMEGKHTIDTGLLSLPVLIENMMLIGDTAGIEYNTGLQDSPKKDRDTLAQRGVEKLMQEKNIKTEDKNIDMAEESITEEPQEQEEPKGLMSRRMI